MMRYMFKDYNVPLDAENVSSLAYFSHIKYKLLKYDYIIQAKREFDRANSELENSIRILSLEKTYAILNKNKEIYQDRLLTIHSEELKQVDSDISISAQHFKEVDESLKAIEADIRNIKYFQFKLHTNPNTDTSMYEYYAQTLPSKFQDLSYNYTSNPVPDPKPISVSTEVLTLNKSTDLQLSPYPYNTSPLPISPKIQSPLSKPLFKRLRLTDLSEDFNYILTPPTLPSPTPLQDLPRIISNLEFKRSSLNFSNSCQDIVIIRYETPFPFPLLGSLVRLSRDKHFCIHSNITLKEVSVVDLLNNSIQFTFRHYEYYYYTFSYKNTYIISHKIMEALKLISFKSKLVYLEIYDCVSRFSISDDERYLCVVSDISNRLDLWNIQQRRIVYAIHAGKHLIKECYFNIKKAEVICVYETGEVYKLDMNTFIYRRRIKIDTDRLERFLITENGKYLILHGNKFVFECDRYTNQRKKIKILNLERCTVDTLFMKEIEEKRVFYKRVLRNRYLVYEIEGCYDDRFDKVWDMQQSKPVEAKIFSYGDKDLYEMSDDMTLYKGDYSFHGVHVY